MVKAIIFDLDDTLISEREYIKSGYHHVSKLLSKQFQKSEDEIYNLLIELFNEDSRNVFNRLFDKLGFQYKHDTIINLVEEYRNHIPTLQFFSDVSPFLKELKIKEIKTGIITDGYANAQRQKLKAVNAHNYFDEIIVTDELGREYWKPHPKAFEIMKEKMNVNYSEMIYIGDNPEKDFYIRSLYPVRTVRITRNNMVYKNKAYYGDIREDFTISSLDEMIYLDILKK